MINHNNHKYHPTHNAQNPEYQPPNKKVPVGGFIRELVGGFSPFQKY